MITIDIKDLAREFAAELYRLQQGGVQPSERTLDTVVEFAERMKVSLRLVRKWVALGMPSIRAGRLRRIIVADAQRWLAEGGDKGAAAFAGIAAARRSALRAISGGKNGKPTRSSR